MTDLIFNPLQLSILLMLLALAFRFKRWMKLAAASSALSGSILILFSNPYFSNHLIHSLEQKFPAKTIQSMPPTTLGIVLGANYLDFPDQTYSDRFLTELVDASDRLHHASRLYRAGKIRRILVLAEPSDESSKAKESRTNLTLSLLQEWGVPASAVKFNTVSRNTYENALEASHYMRNTNTNTPVLLITSAYHMPRAIDTFSAIGIEAIPAPTDYRAAHHSNMLPTTKSLRLSQLAIHEYIGRWWYQFKKLTRNSFSA